MINIDPNIEPVRLISREIETPIGWTEQSTAGEIVGVKSLWFYQSQLQLDELGGRVEHKTPIGRSDRIP